MFPSHDRWGAMRVGGINLLEELKDLDEFCRKQSKLAALATGLTEEEIQEGLKEAINQMLVEPKEEEVNA